MVSRRTWMTASGGCLLAALVIAAFSGVLVRAPNRVIHVRWVESIDASARATIERRFRIEPLTRIEPTTWRYEVIDASRANLEGLVAHPGVDDTHFLDRATFAIQTDAPLAPRRPAPFAAAWPWLAFGVVDYGPPLLLVLALVAAACARWPDLATPSHLRAALVRGIPELSPRGLAVFRLVYGVALAAYIALQPFPLEAVSRADQRSDVILIDMAAIQWLAAHPGVVRVGQWVALASAAAFAAGVVPRVAYAITVAGMVPWLLALSLQADSHPFGVLLLPLLALLAVPWHDAPPVFRGGAAAAVPRARRYGYAPWLLGFALGVAWLGAAWAKVREGPEWILNGTVRYHFVSDSYQAPVDWGLTLATMPILAVLLSAGAIAIEMLTIGASFIRLPVLRLLIGVAAMSVLAGFYLFQGIAWPAWWLLLLGFLPWQWFDTRSEAIEPARTPSLTRSQALWIGVLAVQQLVMSTAFLELPPVASRYDMYSKTHASPADYDRENPGIGRRIVAEDAAGTRTDVTECAAERDGAYWAVLGALTPGTPPPSTAPLKACRTNGEPVRYVLVESRCPFDWIGGRFHCLYRDKPIATLPPSD